MLEEEEVAYTQQTDYIYAMLLGIAIMVKTELQRCTSLLVAFRLWYYNTSTLPVLLFISTSLTVHEHFRRNLLIPLDANLRGLPMILSF